MNIKTISKVFTTYLIQMLSKHDLSMKYTYFNVQARHFVWNLKGCLTLLELKL